MRAHLAFALLAITACAASHPDTSRPTTESVRVAGQAVNGSIRMASSDGASTASLPFAVDRIWSTLPNVYDSLSIPVQTVDPARRLIGNEGFKAHQKLGKTSLSKYIDCGRTQGFPSADSYDVHLTVTTHVQSASEGKSTISTFVEAAARPMAFSGDYVKCASLGVLESAINSSVRGRLAKG